MGPGAGASFLCSRGFSRQVWQQLVLSQPLGDPWSISWSSPLSLYNNTLCMVSQTLTLKLANQVSHDENSYHTRQLCHGHGSMVLNASACFHPAPPHRGVPTQEKQLIPHHAQPRK